jgi:hypothetical protein
MGPECRGHGSIDLSKQTKPDEYHKKTTKYPL